MKKPLRNILILLSPFLLMAVVNETARTRLDERPYQFLGIRAKNTAQYVPDRCSWACHNETKYCKAHHVRYLRPFYAMTDVFYFGVITLLRLTGGYVAANIILLVFLLPMGILYLAIRSLDMEEQIRKLSRSAR